MTSSEELTTLGSKKGAVIWSLHFVALLNDRIYLFIFNASVEIVSILDVTRE